MLYGLSKGMRGAARAGVAPNGEPSEAGNSNTIKTRMLISFLENW
jgi:hypothetical protein